MKFVRLVRASRVLHRGDTFPDGPNPHTLQMIPTHLEMEAVAADPEHMDYKSNVLPTTLGTNMDEMDWATNSPISFQATTEVGYEPNSRWPACHEAGCDYTEYLIRIIEEDMEGKSHSSGATFHFLADFGGPLIFEW